MVVIDEKMYDSRKSSKSNHHHHKHDDDRSGHHHKRRHSESSEEEMKIHDKRKDTNGMHQHANTPEDEKRNTHLKELATDVKGKEAVEYGAFENFDLPSELVEKLRARNVTYLYPIQVATLKHIRAGHDVIAQARTGTGKTLAFAVPLVEKLESSKSKGDDHHSRHPRVLVLEPTRELAKQVGDDFSSISSKLRTVCVYGGVAYEKQRNYTYLSYLIK